MSPIIASLPSGDCSEAIRRLEAKLDEALAALKNFKKHPADRHVLSTSDAMQLVNCRSRSTFERWLIKYAPFARLNAGRYSRSRLEIGLARELNGAKE